MEKKQKDVDRYCTTCGFSLMEGTVPAERFISSSLFSIYSVERYDRFNNKTGEKQFLREYKCPNFGENKGCLFRKKVKHDKFALRMDGIDYSTHFEGTGLF